MKISSLLVSFIVSEGNKQTTKGEKISGLTWHWTLQYQPARQAMSTDNRNVSVIG